MESHSIQNPKKTPYLDWIKQGKKKYEGRLSSKKEECKLFVSKQIKFHDQNKPDSYIICEITELLDFEDFGKAYDVLGDMLIPNSNKNEVIRMYNKIFDPNNYDKLNDGVTSDQIKCVVAIGIKVIEQQ
ncbi:MAG TPA: hypothetical protein VKR58_13410 [Aquella sp.]|nr:hypothetical protein [Aquella sp.]